MAVYDPRRTKRSRVLVCEYCACWIVDLRKGGIGNPRNTPDLQTEQLPGFETVSGDRTDRSPGNRKG